MISDLKNIIRVQLEHAENNLSTHLRIPVEIPPSIENYKLSHPIGAYLVVYRGSSYKDKGTRPKIAQDRDVEIGVVVVSRFRNEYTPEDYLDFAIKSLSGLEMTAKRSDRKVYCASDEWIKEENGVWWYAATFVCPVDFFEGIG